MASEYSRRSTKQKDVLQEREEPPPISMLDTLCRHLQFESGDVRMLSIAVIVLVAGLLLGYFFHGDCGGIKARLEEKEKVIQNLEIKFDRLETSLNRFLDVTLNTKVESKLDELDNKIFQKLETTIQSIETKFIKMSSSMEQTDQKLAESLVEIQASEKRIRQLDGEFSDTLGKAKRTIESWNSEISESKVKAKQMSTEIDSAKEELKTKVTDFKEKSENVITILHTIQKDSTFKIETMASESIQALETKNQEHIGKIQSAIDGFQKTTEDGGKALTTFMKTLKDVGGHSTEIKGIAQQIRTNADALQQSRDALEGNLNHIEERLRDLSQPVVGYNYVTWSLIIIGFTIVLLQRRENKTNNRAYSPTEIRTSAQPKPQRSRTPPRVSPAMSVSRTSLPRAGPPEYDITVVTFTEETLSRSRTLFQDMVGTSWPGQGKVEYKMLSGTLDLSKIPPSRGYIVVIGFDARNTIVEDMDGTMGSRKRETISGLSRTNGDVLVVYIDNDDQLGEPLEGALYNTHLERPTNHPVLRPLVARQRFLSLRRWGWTRMQANHVERWVHGLIK